MSSATEEILDRNLCFVDCPGSRNTAKVRHLVSCKGCARSNMDRIPGRTLRTSSHG